MLFIKGSAIVLVVDGYPTIKCERRLFSNIESDNLVMAVVRTTNDAFFLTIRLTEMSNNTCLWHVKVVVKPMATDIKIIGSDLTIYTICESSAAQREQRYFQADNLTAQAVTVALAAGQTQEIPQDICVHLISRPVNYDTDSTCSHSEDPYLIERYHIIADKYPTVWDSIAYDTNVEVKEKSDYFDSEYCFLYYMQSKYPNLFLTPVTDYRNGAGFREIELSDLPTGVDGEASVVAVTQRKAAKVFNSVWRRIETRLETNFV